MAAITHVLWDQGGIGLFGKYRRAMGARWVGRTLTVGAGLSSLGGASMRKPWIKSFGLS